MGKAKRLRKERKKQKVAKAAADSYIHRLARNLGMTPAELKEAAKQGQKLLDSVNNWDDFPNMIEKILFQTLEQFENKQNKFTN